MLSLITWSIFMILECSSNKKNLSPLWMSTFFPLSYMKCFSSAVCIGSKVQWQLMSWTVNAGLQVGNTTEEELNENTTLTRQDHRFLTQNWNKKTQTGWKMLFDKYLLTKCKLANNTNNNGQLVNLLYRSLTGLMPAPKGSNRQASDTQWLEFVLLMSYNLQWIFNTNSKDFIGEDYNAI